MWTSLHNSAAVRPTVPEIEEAYLSFKVWVIFKEDRTLDALTKIINMQVCGTTYMPLKTSPYLDHGLSSCVVKYSIESPRRVRHLSLPVDLRIMAPYDKH